LTPQLLKAALVHHLNELLAPIRAEFDADPEWQEIQRKAYPVEEKVKKEKKKDKGDPAKRAAAAAARKGIVSQPDGHVEGEGAHAANVGPKTEELLQKLDVKDS
jgi:tyrosyl-tRNA synthetase